MLDWAGVKYLMVVEMYVHIYYCGWLSSRFIITSVFDLGINLLG